MDHADHRSGSWWVIDIPERGDPLIPGMNLWMRGQCTCYRAWTTGPTSLPFLSRNGGEILSLAERRGASNVRVFGSVARDEARADSDVDFLVDLDPDRSLLDVGGLAMDLSLLLDRPVDVVTEAGLRERIRSRVLREARPL